MDAIIQLVAKDRGFEVRQGHKAESLEIWRNDRFKGCFANRDEVICFFNGFDMAMEMNGQPIGKWAF